MTPTHPPAYSAEEFERVLAECEEYEAAAGKATDPIILSALRLAIASARAVAMADPNAYANGFDACWKMFDRHLYQTVIDRVPHLVNDVMRLVDARSDRRAKAPHPSLPGWRLVPEEATEEMIAAFNNQMMREFGIDASAGYYKRIWGAMLAASPSPPAAEPLWDYEGALSDLDAALDVLVRRINGEASLESAAEWLRLNYPDKAGSLKSPLPISDDERAASDFGAGQQSGAEDERQRIVAWLRGLPSPGEMDWTFGDTARQIEAGQHWKEVMPDASEEGPDDKSWPPVAMPGAATPKMEEGDLLNYCSDDASKWAAEFRATALRLGYSDMDEGWLIGWFANAIEHSTMVRRDRVVGPQPAAPDQGGR